MGAVQWAAAAGISGMVLACGCRGTASESPPGPLVAQATPSASASPSTPPATTSPPAAASPAPAPPTPACGDPGDVLVFVAPEHPVRGQQLRVVAVTDHLVDAQLALSPPSGTKADAASVTAAGREGGPPYFWVASVDAPAAGKWQATLARDAACGGATIASKDVRVSSFKLRPPGTPRTSLWFTRASWSPSYENLYSAWIEHMFDAPLDEQPTWNALHEVLRDRTRNFLFDFNGAAEDEQNVIIKPDCADLPYFLRAYFAFKLGLPFAWSRCRGRPPTCTEFATQSNPFPAPAPADAGAPDPAVATGSPAPAPPPQPPTLPTWANPDRDDAGPWEANIKRLGEFFRTTLADVTESSAGRVPATDDTSDYYPIKLAIESLRPGTIFADPYGHVLVIAKRIPQTPTSGGVLLAVDGQPDGTVARKRFWRGNFLFVIDPALGSAGFKRFRPVVPDPHDPVGKYRHLRNAELPDFSATDQYAGGAEGFYDKMEDVLSPAPLDPMQALLETIDALEEQVKTRVHSVDNGRKFLASGKPVAEMPVGATIFETTGEWEDFSTPSRDLRILIAIDVARALPTRVARRPERYKMPPGETPEQVRAQMEARLAKELKERTFEYVRSDGSPWKLALQDVVERQAALEMAYNPNDCVELRWGAPASSNEATTCQAHAPAAQVAKMTEYRSWFHDRKRPGK
jgi:hypothetical protein